MSVTIAYFSSRKEPMFEWFVESLCKQATPEELADVEVLFIDRHLWLPSLFRGAKQHTEWIDITDRFYHDPSRVNYANDCVKERFAFLHIPPKPSVFAGPWRLTSKDWFCASNARNTAFIFATHRYIVGVDDLSVLMPGWWNQVKHAASGGYCVAGAYKKVKDLVVADGEAKSFTEFPPGVDSRWNRGSESGVVKWSGAGVFGCSFGLPLDLALHCDGFDFACNSVGAEDYDFGIRVERAGGEWFYNRNMLTFESEERHHTEPSLPRESREVTNLDMLPRGYSANRMSDHVLLNRVTAETRRATPLLPDNILLRTLREQRDRLERDGFVNVPREPEYHWIDKKPLKEL